MRSLERYTAWPESPLILILSVIGLIALDLLSEMPAYTRLAFVFLLLPMIFIVFRKSAKINTRKYYIILLLSIVATIIWDTVAIHAWLWNFPPESVIYTIQGIPLEDFLWGLWFPTIVIGIYTSLPHFLSARTPSVARLHFRETVLKAVLFVVQLIVATYLFFNTVNYFAWVVFLALIPSLFFVLRRNERIDEYRLMLTIGCMVGIVVLMDLVFIPAGTWYYNPDAILGSIGIIPVDDFLFAIFNAILTIGFYTSMPDKQFFTRKW